MKNPWSSKRGFLYNFRLKSAHFSNVFFWLLQKLRKFMDFWRRRWHFCLLFLLRSARLTPAHCCIFFKYSESLIKKKKKKKKLNVWSVYVSHSHTTGDSEQINVLVLVSVRPEMKEIDHSVSAVLVIFSSFKYSSDSDRRLFKGLWYCDGQFPKNHPSPKNILLRKS